MFRVSVWYSQIGCSQYVQSKCLIQCLCHSSCLPELLWNCQVYQEHLQLPAIESMAPLCWQSHCTRDDHTSHYMTASKGEKISSYTNTENFTLCIKILVNNTYPDANSPALSGGSRWQATSLARWPSIFGGEVRVQTAMQSLSQKLVGSRWKFRPSPTCMEVVGTW